MLTQGYKAIVDDEDVMKVILFDWHVFKCDNTNYARRSNAYGIILMHRLLLNLTDPKFDADHINHNGLDNRKENLRIVTRN